MRGLSPVAALAAVATTCGCALPQSSVPTPYALVHDTKDPAQYRSPLPHEVQNPPAKWPEGRGEACRTMVSFPPNPPTPFVGSSIVANYNPYPSFDATWGNAGYARAVEKALQDSPGASLIDVRADLHTTSVLGIWRRECIEVRGLLAK